MNFNYVIMFVYIIAVMFIKLQYEKYLELNSESDNYHRKNLQDIIGEIVIIGLASGFAGSGIIISLGITIEAGAVKYLFMAICLLALVNLRYACISYSAGLVALVSLIFGYPVLNVPSLLGMAAVMQLMESLLIFLLGNKDNIPVFIKHNGELTGAFMIRKFWPVPVIFLTSVLSNVVGTNPGVRIQWSSLFTPETLKTGAFALGLDCIIAIICYTDMAISTHPAKKARKTGLQFFVYSLLLLAISIMSINIVWLRYLGAVFCIGAHEGIILYNNYIERKGKPLYTPVWRGLKVLDVLPGSHAEKMGLQGGDVILRINGNDIQTNEGVREALSKYPVFTWIDVISWDGTAKSYEYRCYPDGYNNLGIIFVPREKEVTYNTDYFEHLSILKNIVNRFRDTNGSV